MEEINYNELLSVASLAGRIIIENGGEIYRVEQTIMHMCYSFGAKACDCYAAPTAILVSVVDPEDKVYSTILRINSRTNNLARVEHVNTVSRSIKKDGNITLDKVREELLAVEEEKTYPWWLDLICGGVVAGSFAIMTGNTILDFFCAFAIGVIIRAVTSFMSKNDINIFVVNMTGGVIAAFMAWLSVKAGIGANQYAIIVSSIMLLVPGLLLSNSFRDIATGDLIAGLSRSIEALAIAAAIACGVAMFFGFVNIIGGIAL